MPRLDITESQFGRHRATRISRPSAGACVPISGPRDLVQSSLSMIMVGLFHFSCDTRMRASWFRTLSTFLAAVAGCLTVAASSESAVEPCSIPSLVPAPEEIGEQFVRSVPAKYYQAASEISIRRSQDRRALFPFATVADGKKLVVVNPLFSGALCKFVFSTFALGELKLNLFEDKALAADAEGAKTCLESGKQQDDCLAAFAEAMWLRSKEPFLALPPDRQEQASTFLVAAMAQILRHEYAHHLLEHLEGLKSRSISRADAEFEADYFAVMNGIDSGEPPTGLFYVFHPLREVELRRGDSALSLSENFSCRLLNVVNITAFTMNVPVKILVWAQRRYTKTTWAAESASIGAFFDEKSPTPLPGSCGRLSADVLANTHTELRRLFLVINGHGELLTSEAVEQSQSATVVAKLAQLARESRYTKSLIAKVISYVFAWTSNDGLKLTPLVTALGETATVASMESMQSVDYGRFLKSLGLATMQEGVQLQPTVRLNKAADYMEKAVEYNPDLTEAWATLGMIAFKRADCAKAALLFGRAVETNADSASRETFELGRKRMQDLTKDPDRCSAEAAAFRPFPGF